MMCNTTLSQTTREEVFADLNKCGGVYYAYPLDFKSQTPVPDGYEAFYISHYGRHGSRYLLSDNDYKWILDVMNEANDKNALTPLGKDVLEKLRLVWADAEGHGDELSPVGIAQHRGIAERMYNNFPTVFADSINISARSTTSMRCALSMFAFCQRLTELNPTLNITFEASRRNMAYMNYHSPEHGIYNSDKGPWRKIHQQFAKKQIQPERLIQSLFNNKEYIKNIDGSQVMWALYWIAVDLQDMPVNINMYDIFEPQELFNIWQVMNFHFYVSDSNSKLNNGLPLESCKPLLSNIIETAREAIINNRNEVTLRFGHDGNVIPLAAILHLDGCYDDSTDQPEEFYKVWSDFKVSPMAGNIQIIFYRHKTNGDVIVKFMLNETEKNIPVNSDIKPYYHWKDIESYYNTILKDK